MRRRLSERTPAVIVRQTVVAAVVCLFASREAAAQRGVVTQGARELLLPIGARTIGVGQAVVADQMGSEGIWSNPASFGWASRAEGGLHHVQAVLSTTDLLSLVYPVRPVGVLGAALSYVNLGCDEITDRETGEVIGQDCSRVLTALAGFGTTFGRNLSAGITYKVFQAKYLSEKASTTAVDFGAQYRVRAVPGLRVGAAVRHLGLRLQVRDEAQADKLPTTFEAGASYERRVAVADTAVNVRVSASIVDRMQSEGPGFRLGTEADWRNAYFARAGYVLYSPTGSYAALGLGAAVGRLRIDVARAFGDYSSALGESPTYLSLRVTF